MSSKNKYIPQDLSENTKNNFIRQIFFSHRTSHSYNLLNEIILLKLKPKVNQKNNLSLNTKQKWFDQEFQKPTSSILKKIQNKLIHSFEENSNEKQSKSDYFLTLNNKSNKRKDVNNEKENNKVKMIYNSIDIKKDDLKKYWTQNKNSLSMKFIQIDPKKNNKGRSIKKKYKSLIQFKLNLLNNEDLKNDSIQKQTNNFTKLFKKLQNKRNCNSYHKRKAIQTVSTNSINIDFVRSNLDKAKRIVKNVNDRKNNKNNSEFNKNLKIQKSRKTNRNNENENNSKLYKPNKQIQETYKGEIIVKVNNLKDIIKKPKKVNKDTELNDYISPDKRDEKRIPISHLPIFAAKKLTYYYSSTFIYQKLKQCFSCERTYTVFIYYMNINDILCLSLVNKECEKQTKQFRYNLIKTNIIKQYKQPTKQISNKIWKSLAQYSKLSLVPYLKKTYLDHAFKQSCYLADIKKDIIRTYPQDPLFKENSLLYKQLLYILNAYANYNPQIGYAQGINFIVAKIIPRSKSEEDAFLLLDSIMNKLYMETVVGISNQLYSKMNHIGELLSQALPSFVLFLKKYSLSHELFTANWVITLFSSTVDIDELYIIWDYIFIFGWKFVYCLIISIIKTFQSNIVTSKFDNYSGEIKQILCSQKFKQQFENIIDLSFELINKLKQNKTN